MSATRKGGRAAANGRAAASASAAASARTSTSTVTPDRSPGSPRRAHMVKLAGELFAQKGYRATSVREIAKAAGILSGSLYHHFDSKESIGDEILSSFMNEVLADYRQAVAAAPDPRAALEQIVKSSSRTLSRHRAALTMLQNDWSYFAAQPRFGYLRDALREFEQTWITQLELGMRAGLFRQDLDPALTYRLLRDVLWIPSQWRRSGGYGVDQVADGLLRLIFDGIAARPA